MAETFIPNPDNLPIINHKDENPINNVVTNLEWCTVKYNSNYGTRNQRLSETLRKVKKNEGIKILCIETGIIYSSIKEAERQTGIDHSSINRAIHNKVCYDRKGRIYKIHTAGGYHWKHI